MVYRGKPSAGCAICRSRKIRCDQLAGGCTQCSKAKRECPGYRDVADLMFCNESDRVIKKAKANAKSRAKAFKTASTGSSPSTRPTDPASTPSVHSSTGAVNDGNNVEDPDIVDTTIQPPAAVEETALFSIQQWQQQAYKTAFQKQWSQGQSWMSTFSMFPTLDERGTGFFFSNFTTSITSFQPTAVVVPTSMGQALLTSASAVGLAGFAGFAHAPDLKVEATKRYMEAIRQTNAALACPSEATKDTTLLSILNLTLFETIAGGAERSLDAWQMHIDGAASLLKLRGEQQLSRAGGLIMYMQTTTSLIARCILQDLPIPSHISDLAVKAANLINSHDPTWRFFEVQLSFTNFNADVLGGRIKDPRTIIERALELDVQTMRIFEHAGPMWDYEVVYTNEDSDVVFGGRYHVYDNYMAAQVWNGMRTTRIMLNDIVRLVLLRGFAAKPPWFSSLDDTARFQLATDTVLQLQADILASVPQHIGYVDSRTGSDLNYGSIARKSASFSMADPPFSFPWSDFGTHRNGLWDGADMNTATQLPIIRAYGGYLTPWAVFVAGNIDACTIPLRKRIMGVLKLISRRTGVEQLSILARMMESKMEQSTVLE